MSEKQIADYKNELKRINEEITKIKSKFPYNLLSDKFRLDILEKEFEYTEILREIAILEKKDESYIKQIEEERNHLLKRVIEFRRAEGLPNTDIEDFIEKQKGVRIKI